MQVKHRLAVIALVFCAAASCGPCSGAPDQGLYDLRLEMLLLPEANPEERRFRLNITGYPGGPICPDVPELEELFLGEHMLKLEGTSGFAFRCFGPFSCVLTCGGLSGELKITQELVFEGAPELSAIIDGERVPIARLPEGSLGQQEFFTEHDVVARGQDLAFRYLPTSHRLEYWEEGEVLVDSIDGPISEVWPTSFTDDAMTLHVPADAAMADYFVMAGSVLIHPETCHMAVCEPLRYYSDLRADFTVQ